MDSETKKNNRKENNQTKKDFKNSVKFKDFEIIFNRAEKGYQATYSNEGFKYKTKDGFPYVFKTVKRKNYGSGLKGLFYRLIGAYEIEMVDGYICENNDGKMIDFISKDYGEVQYEICDGKLSHYPFIKIKYRPGIGEEFSVNKYIFHTQEEYDFFFDYIYNKIK